MYIAGSGFSILWKKNEGSICFIIPISIIVLERIIWFRKTDSGIINQTFKSPREFHS